MHLDLLVDLFELIHTGFGDYTPVQPAGKVFFIIYALMAVPIVTSFAVQTITGLVIAFVFDPLYHMLISPVEHIFSERRPERGVHERKVASFRSFLFSFRICAGRSQSLWRPEEKNVRG